MIGTIEKIKYTTSSFGEQYITIAGVEYMTFWDISKLKKGAEVEIEISPPRTNCFVGNSQIEFAAPQASFVRFIDQVDPDDRI